MRAVSTFAATAAVALALTAPAHADTTTYTFFNTAVSWGVTGVTKNEGGGVADPVRTLVVTARAQNLGQPTSSPYTDASLQCTATAGPGVLETALTGCYLRGQFTGHKYRVGDDAPVPGPLDVAMGATLHLIMEPFEVCGEATARYVDGIVLATPPICASN